MSVNSQSFIEVNHSSITDFCYEGEQPTTLKKSVTNQFANVIFYNQTVHRFFPLFVSLSCVAYN